MVAQTLMTSGKKVFYCPTELKLTLNPLCRSTHLVHQSFFKDNKIRSPLRLEYSTGKRLFVVVHEDEKNQPSVLPLKLLGECLATLVKRVLGK